ncbi:MAG: PorV/PorQ family protein, partial [Gemmatimonadota bacterium]|nr:PorV/PorQ family protein [Gemmatimonadota bacterium]
MSKSLLPLALVLLLTGAVHAASRYAGEFLGLGAGARSAALGSAYVALADDATAGYWNAAGLSALSGRQVHLTHAEHFSGLIQRDFVAVARPGRLLHGMALSLVRMGIGDIHFTELPDPLQPPSTDNRPLIASTEQSADYALYLSGSRRLGARLSLGLSAKAIYRQVSSINAYGFGLDLGVRYQLSHQIALAANVRDATTTPIVWNMDSTDRIQPSLLLGVAYAIPIAEGQTTALLATRSGGDASTATDDVPLNAGLEYRHRYIALRAGLEEGRQSFGLGLTPHHSLDLDLAYLQHDALEATYQLSASF